MAVYPGAIPAKPSINTADMSAATTHTTDRGMLWDELRAIAIELGTSPSGAASTVVIRLNSNDNDIATLQGQTSAIRWRGSVAAQSITTATFGTLTPSTETEDTGTIWTSGTGFTIPTSAVYAFMLRTQPATGNTADDICRVTIGATDYDSGKGAAVGQQTFTVVQYVSATTAVTFSIFNASASTRNYAATILIARVQTT